MQYKIIFPALMLCLGMLNGCGATRPSKFYQLTPASDRASGADPSPYPVTLLLGPITSSRLYRDDRIVYTSNGQAMGMYEYQRWAEPPSDMIDDVLLRELRVSGRYQHVYSLRSDVRGDYLLMDACMISARSTERCWLPVSLSSSSWTTQKQG